MGLRRFSTALAIVAGLALTACGGGGGGGSSGGTTPPPTVTLTSAEASRLLIQAGYGPTDADISQVKALGVSAWIDQQIATPGVSAQAYMDSRLPALVAANPKATLSSSQFYEFYWSRTAGGADQLRQRVALALSEIFVTSFADPSVDARGMGSYWDMLSDNAFGNYRVLLEKVTLHPMMGIYLTDIANQKENLTTGTHPDENYAREVMQLMTIGLYQLNQDGTNQVDLFGNTTSTYSHDDIADLAKVFTGMSYYSPTPTNTTFFGGNRDANWAVTPMIFYPQFHSTSQKVFLGTTIAASATSDPAGDLRIALDTLFNHHNVGPFIGRRLIQSLVTSNPSPGYVSRVAAVFNDNGHGVRGDMAAVVKAIMTDSEARDASVAGSATFGKLREPVVRGGNWMRTFGATSQTGLWQVGSTSASTSLFQSPLTAPSVFNFWRPGYVPPNSKLGTAKLVAPEFQGVDEVTVSGYLNTIQAWVERGAGPSQGATGLDVQSAYASELALAGDAVALTDRLNLMLYANEMSVALRQKIIDTVNTIAIPGGAATPAQINAAKLQRVKLAVFLAMASGEYLAQR